MANKNSFNRPIKDSKPRRKIGRYILLILLLVPLALELRSYDFGPWIPKINVRFDVEKKIEKKMQVASVIIEGDLTYTSKETLQSAIITELGENFVNTKLDDVRSAALTVPWVRSAAISRVWPNSIKIVIEEQQPIARWGNDGFVNRYGNIVNVGNTSVLEHLPVLSGPQKNAYDIAKEYLVFANLLSEYQLYVSSLNVDENGEWNIEVNRSFHIALGKHDLSKRLERFLYVFRHQLASVEKDIALVDLRYKKGLAVKWKSDSQMLEANKKTLVSG